MIRTSEYDKSKKALFTLIEELPDKEVYNVKNYIEFLIAKNKKNKNESFWDYLNSLPEEDEELTEEALREIEKRSEGAKKDLKQNKLKSLKYINKRYGL